MDAFGALCTTFNDDPDGACRPFDVSRAGTCLSDGGGMILLESEEHAEMRNAPNRYVEVAGFGQTNDASSILRPNEDGSGVISAILTACIQSGIHPSEISAYNCHARATIYGDLAEAVAIRSIMAAGKKYPTFEQFS